MLGSSSMLCALCCTGEGKWMADTSVDPAGTLHASFLVFHLSAAALLGMQVLIQVAAAIIALYGVLLLAFRPRLSSKEHPLVSGFIPWVGAGLRFMKDPRKFLWATAAKHPAGFTMHAGGKLLTFFNSPEGIAYFYKVRRRMARVSDVLHVAATDPFCSRAAMLPWLQAPSDELSFYDGVKEFFAGVFPIGQEGPETDNLPFIAIKKYLVPHFGKYVSP